MNTTTNGISNVLLAAPYQLNMWFGSFLCIAGNIGCIGNSIVFRSPAFRERAYSIYLFWEAISDFIYFNFVLMSRILQKGFQIPVLIRYDAVCKLRQFLTDWSNQFSFSLFSFATIDRLLSAQREIKYRQLSNRIGLAYRVCMASAFGWFLVFGHRLILYRATGTECISLAGFYNYFDAYNEIFFKAICPPIVMISLAYLLIRSVRGVIRRRIAPVNRGTPVGMIRQNALQQMDSRMTLMLILQSIIAILTYLPFAIELTYTSITQTWSKSALQKAQEKVFIELTHILSYTFFASSFFVSFITNAGCRRQIKRCFKRLRQNDTSIRGQTIFHTHAATAYQAH